VFPSVVPSIGKKIETRHPLAQGLIGLYTFSSCYPGLAYDHSIYRQKAEMLVPNSNRLIWGKHDFAHKFTSISDGFHIKNGFQSSVYAHPVFRLTSQFTIAVWVKVQYGSNVEGNTQIFGCLDEPLLNGYGLVIHVDELGIPYPGLVLMGNRSGVEEIISDVPFEDNEWIHLAVTFRYGQIKFYMNGVKNHETSGPTGVDYQNPNQIYSNIGFDGTETNYFVGRMESAWHYSRALSSEEIQQLNDAPYDIFETHDEWVPLIQSSTNNYSEVATGGVNCAGAATISKRSSVTASAGVGCAGVAGVVKIQNVIGSAGIAVGSAASVRYIANVNITPAGVGCAATVNNFDTFFIVTSGGIVCNNSASVFVRSSFTASAGVLFAGAATVSKRYTFNVSNGAKCAGDIEVTLNVFFEIASGGITSNGAARYLAVFNIMGGCGEFDDSFSSAFNLRRSGLKANGDATQTITNIFLGVGGAKCAGVATTIQTINIAGSSNGCNLGGIAEDYRLLSWTATNGVQVAGAASENSNNVVVSTGGMICNGTAYFSKLSTPVASNGLICNGTLGFSYRSNPVISGGLYATGSAVDVLYVAGQSVIGGLTLNGSALTITNLNVITSNGLQAGATANIFAVYNIIGGYGGSGSQFSNSFDSDFQVDTSTAIRLGGSASLLTNWLWIATGGITTNGTASQDTSFTSIVATGGLTLNGIAIVGDQPASSGGLFINGNANPIIYYTLLVNGGIVTAGASPPSLVYNSLTANGVVINGVVIVSLSSIQYIGNGTILTASQTHVTGLNFYLYQSSGNINVSGGISDSLFGNSYIGNGVITVSGDSQPNSASYKLMPKGKSIVIGGATVALPGQYSYEGNGTILISQGSTKVSATFKNRYCEDGSLPCIRPIPNKYLDCLKGQYFYRNCAKAAPDKCFSGAILPTITDCRQKGILPLKNRRPPRVKR
jgi:hypothetical protein